MSEAWEQYISKPGATDDRELLTDECIRADLLDRQCFHGAAALQNQVKNGQHQRAEAAGHRAPAEKVPCDFFHAFSYLLRISAKQRRET